MQLVIEGLRRLRITPALAEGLDPQHADPRIKRDGQHIAGFQAMSRRALSLSIEANPAAGNKFGGISAGTHHARVPQPFVEALPLQPSIFTGAELFLERGQFCERRVRIGGALAFPRGAGCESAERRTTILAVAAVTLAFELAPAALRALASCLVTLVLRAARLRTLSLRPLAAILAGTTVPPRGAFLFLAAFSRCIRCSSRRCRPMAVMPAMALMPSATFIVAARRTPHLDKLGLRRRGSSVCRFRRGLDRCSFSGRSVGGSSLVCG